MRAVLFIMAFAALIAICQGGGWKKCNVANCAKCQDSKKKCKFCAEGYVASGKRSCVPNSAYNCPAAAGPNCVSCSPASPGGGNLCTKNWNATWGCTLCAQGYQWAASTTPFPSGTGKQCGKTSVLTCISDNDVAPELTNL
jgi:hypothetical protein